MSIADATHVGTHKNVRMRAGTATADTAGETLQPDMRKLFMSMIIRRRTERTTKAL